MDSVTDKQTCTKCNKEKPLNEYHRRGAGHKRICKECLNSKYRADYAVRGRGRVEKAPRQEPQKADFPAMQERINQLLPKIRATIYRFVVDPENFEDTLQIAIESILERCNMKDTDSYILTCARYAAMSQMRKSGLESLYHPPLSNGEESPEILVRIARSAEDEIIQREGMSEIKKIIDSLPPKNRKIISMLALGYEPCEIAKITKTTDSNISFHVQSFRARLALAGITSPVVTVGVV